MLVRFHGGYGGPFVCYHVSLDSAVQVLIFNHLLLDFQVALRLVRKELEVLGTSKETPLTIEEVPVLSGTAIDVEKEDGEKKTNSEVVLVEVSLHFQGL